MLCTTTGCSQHILSSPRCCKALCHGGCAFEGALNSEAGPWPPGSQRILVCKMGSFVAARQQTGQCALISFQSLNSDRFLAVKHVAENKKARNCREAAKERQIWWGSSSSCEQPCCAPWLQKSKVGGRAMEPQVADLLSFLLITQIDATWLQEMLVLTLYIMPCTWEPHALKSRHSTTPNTSVKVTVC